MALRIASLAACASWLVVTSRAICIDSKTYDAAAWKGYNIVCPNKAASACAEANCACCCHGIKAMPGACSRGGPATPPKKKPSGKPMPKPMPRPTGPAPPPPGPPKGKPGPSPGPPTKGKATGCGSQPIEDTYQKCMKMAGQKSFSAMSTAMKDCKDKMKTSMQSASGCGGKAPDNMRLKMLDEAAAASELASCKMKREKGCDDKYAAMSGKTLSSDKVIKEARAKFEASKGSATALADKMTGCRNRTCEEKARKDMAALKGRAVSKGEFAFDKKKAGSSKAGSFIKDCVQKAADATEKAKCIGGKGAKEAYARASGKNTTDVKDVDIAKAMRSEATKSVREMLDACSSAAKTDEDRKKCRQKGDLKKLIADSEAKMASTIKDDKVRKYMEDGARTDVLAMAKACDKKQVAKCKDEMKNAWAKASGMTKKNISDDDLKRVKKAAFEKSLGARMVACVEEAMKNDNDTALAECKSKLAKTEMKRADYESATRTPTKGQIERTLKGAGRKTAGEAMEDCNKADRKECFQMMKDRMAKSMGKKGAKVKEVEAEVLNMEQAFASVREMAAACAKVKKDNATATCDDLEKKFHSVRKTKKSTDSIKREAEKSMVKHGALVDMFKEQKNVCTEKTTKKAHDDCMKGFATDAAKQLFSGLPVDEQTKRMATAKMEANREYLGELYTSCMKANNKDKKACMASLTNKTKVTGEKEKPEDALKRYHGWEIAKAGLACASSEAKKCREDVKKAAVETGMKEREFATLKRIGEAEAAAKTWSACTANKTKTDCEAVAKQIFKQVSGSRDDKSWDAVKAKVKKLGEAKSKGVALETRYKKEMHIDVRTSATSCSDALSTTFVSKVGSVLVGNKFAGNKTLSGVVKKRGLGCRMVDGNAELSAKTSTGKFTASEIETASDEMATLMKAQKLDVVGGRLLSEQDSDFLASPRQLATVTVSDAYADQGSELCAADDPHCGGTDPDFTKSDNYENNNGGNPNTIPDKKKLGQANSAWRHALHAVSVMVVLIAAAA